MSESITTSIRLTSKLRRALELKAKREKRGKNWLISRALENYLQQDGLKDLEAEVTRLSLIAAQRPEDDSVRGRRPSAMKIARGDIVLCVIAGDDRKPRPALVIQAEVKPLQLGAA
jgi:predicted DNA-binding protein